jgi:hypothetical protein
MSLLAAVKFACVVTSDLQHAKKTGHTNFSEYK